MSYAWGVATVKAMAMDDQNEATTVRRCRPVNSYLDSMEADFLYHIGYSREQCKVFFRDVKVRETIAPYQDSLEGVVTHLWKLDTLSNPEMQ